MTLRIVFMGTPDFAVPTLAEILGAGHEVLAAYSQPPRPAGRGMAPTKSPVHLFAEQAGIEVRTPSSLKGAPEPAEFASLGVDAAVVVAYGLLLPSAVLAAPRFGCLNLHASALPRWRGAAPIQRAIMAGDATTAATMTAGALHDVLARTGAGLMTRALAALERGALDCQPQAASGVSYAAKIDKAEARIDFARPAREVHNLIRGLSPFPGAWFEAGADGKRERIKVLRVCAADGGGRPGEVLDAQLTVACAEGAVRLLELQRAGKSPMRAADLLRGFSLPPGTLLGAGPR
jgi:methionyl-tRNA formyltransferase